MKYEFIKVDEDTTKLKYKDKEFTFKTNVKLVSEMQNIIKKSRIKIIQDLAKDGISVKSLTIETKKDGKTYYDNSNKTELEKIYQGHKDIVLDIAKKHRIFSDEYLKSLIDEFSLPDSVQTLKELIYNAPLDSGKRNNRPLAKLTQDILEEMENQ